MMAETGGPTEPDTESAGSEAPETSETQEISQPRETTVPRFSVIVPTFNRPHVLAACLAALADQTVPRDSFEVIVVNDGGEDPQTGSPGQRPDRLRVTLLRQPRGGPGSARNLGASHARGRVLAFVDDDCRPDPEWLEKLDCEALQSGALVGGAIENGLPDNAYATASHLITRYAYRYYDDHPKAGRFFTTNNLAMQRETFEALGGFDTSIPAATAEDKDLCDRWLASGGDLVLVPTARVWHAHDLGLRGFIRQHYQYGRGIMCFRVLRRRRSPTRPAPIRPEPWTFYIGLVGYPAKKLGGLKGLVVSGLVGLSQLATALGAMHAVLIDLPRMRSAKPGGEGTARR